MRTNEERVNLIRRRTRELRKEKRRRQRIAVEVLCAAASVLLIVAMGLMMPSFTERAGSGAAHVSGAASLIGSSPALGFILMGIMGFLLGFCVAVLLFKLRRGKKHDVNAEDDA